MIIEFAANEDQLSVVDVHSLTAMMEELLAAHRKGHHYAVVPRQTSSWLIANLNFGPQALATLKRVAAEYTTTGGILASAARYISIDLENLSGPRLLDRVVVVGLNDVRENYFFDRAALVIEDQVTDGKIYTEIAKACIGKISAPSVSFDLRHGGGERSKDVMLHLISEKRICLVVADSDRRMPSRSTPAKILSFQREILGSGWLVASVDFIPCREIENLIPIDVVQQLPCGASSAGELHALRRIGGIEVATGVPACDTFWWYYDLKKGIDRVKLFKVEQDEVRDWIVAKTDLAPCHFDGISETMISQLLNHPTQLPKFLSLVKQPEWWSSFGSVIETIMWFGFAPCRQRV